MNYYFLSLKCGATEHVSKNNFRRPIFIHWSDSTAREQSLTGGLAIPARPQSFEARLRIRSEEILYTSLGSCSLPTAPLLTPLLLRPAHVAKGRPFLKIHGRDIAMSPSPSPPPSSPPSPLPPPVVAVSVWDRTKPGLLLAQVIHHDKSGRKKL
jgi:hypothetical protein